MERKADPEFVINEEQEDPPVSLSWKQRFNVLGFLRLFTGQVRDSSGRANNMLGLLYVAIAFFGAGIWWGTHPAPVKYELDLKLNGQVASRVGVNAKRKRIRSLKNGIHAAQKKVKDLISGPQTARSQIRKYKASDATIHLALTLQPPAPLPASFWWVLLLLVVAFLAAYLGRHPKMRQWVKQMLLAYRAVLSNDSSSTWKEKIVPFLQGVLDGKKHLDASSMDIPSSKEEKDKSESEPIFDEFDLPKREH